MNWPTPANKAGTGLHQSIVEQSQDAIIFADRDGLIRLWNRGAEIIFGYRAQEALGSSLSLIIPEKLRRAHDEGYRLAMERGLLRHAGRVLTTRSQHKYGCRLYVDLRFGLLKDESCRVTVAFAIGRDCTARYLEQKARRVQAAAPG